jgi:hypothetical protein
MIHEVEISPEVVRLAQFRTRTLGATLANELARNIVQEAIYNSDPEMGLMVEEDQAFSKEDSLVAAFGVNDLVVNGKRIDVRPVDEEGRVAISRALIGTSYLSAGTVAVEMNGHLNGKVIGFIPTSEWSSLEKNAGDQQTIYIKAKTSKDFDLTKTLTALGDNIATDSKLINKVPEPFQLASFVANRSEVPIAKQRQIVEGSLANPQFWPSVEKVVTTWSTGAVRRILDHSSSWNRRVERLTDALSKRFKKVGRDDIRKVVEKLGESMGGQPESSEFRKALMGTLTREELGRSLAGVALRKATEVADAVLSGRAVNEVIKDFARNPVAVEIASKINKQRNNLASFMDATTAELSVAYQQLSLQPVYATHSQDSLAGAEAINEALKMIEAGELAESLKSLDDELANI